MKEIPLTQGQIALVDDEDYEFLINFGLWHAHFSGKIFYASAHKKYMHRLLFPDAKYIDHIDHNGLNNQKSNLRKCSHSQNQANRRPQVNNTSGFKGVHWMIQSQKWRASIQFKGIRSYLGYFDCKIKAAKAYDNAAIYVFGEFAKLNFPEENI